MMNRPQSKPGRFFRIPLSDGSFGYGRELQFQYFAFYDYRTAKPSADLDEIGAQSILFAVTVRRRKDLWEFIGTRPLGGKVAQPVVVFQQDDMGRCLLFDTAGMTKEVAPQDCVGLERAAVWDSHQIEERLLDTFLGLPNENEIRLRVRLE